MRTPPTSQPIRPTTRAQTIHRRAVPAASFLLLTLTAAAGAAFAATPLTTVRIAAGLARPLFVGSPPGDPRIFIVEQRGVDNRGRIKIYKEGVGVLAKPFLTTAPLSTGNEQGLLGLAFAPDYATSRLLYVNYTDAGGTTRIVRYQASAAEPDTANPVGELILTISQPYPNHNGGWLGFGPDGYLYIATGDGGFQDDPGNRAQQPDSLLGKMLRIDVSSPGAYKIPPDNPFVNLPGADEVWSIGLRNPFRCCFDRLTGDLVIADVGQFAIEEIDFAPAPARGRGVNYGWRCYEGDNPYLTVPFTPCGTCSNLSCFQFPAYTYTHAEARCSVTGGYVYRGCAIPDLQGTYFFADHCGNQIYSGTFSGGDLVNFAERTTELDPPGAFSITGISSFGEDAQGEMYICDLFGGEVFKIVPAATPAENVQPVLQVETTAGDTLGSTGYGNALTPGIVPFSDPGSRIRGVGYLSGAQARGCVVRTGGCLTAPLRLGIWDVDYQACVDAVNAVLTRTITFTNRSGAAQALDFRDVVAPFLEADDDRGASYKPAAGDSSALLVLNDATGPTLYVSHRGVAAGGATFSHDVDLASAIEARVGGDLALSGNTEAGPGQLALALGFAWSGVAPGASRTVILTTRLSPTAPLDAGGGGPIATGPVLFVLGAMPFRTSLQLALDLPRAGEVSLVVYDARGRRVRQILAGPMEPGRHALSWDGRDDAGAETGAGLYFVRAITPAGDESVRAVRVR